LQFFIDNSGLNRCSRKQLSREGLLIIKREHHGGSRLVGVIVAGMILVSTAALVGARARLFEMPVTTAPDEEESDNGFLCDDYSAGTAALKVPAASAEQTFGRMAATWLLNLLPSSISNGGRNNFYLSLDRAGDRRTLELPASSSTSSTSSSLSKTSSRFVENIRVILPPTILPPIPSVDSTAILWASAGGSAWLTGTNWTGGAVPTGTQVAQFGTNPTAATGAGINFNGITNAGVQVNGSKIQEVGAVEITPARAAGMIIGNSSTTVGATGMFRLNGATINGMSDVIIRNNGAVTLTIQNTQATGTQTMSLLLGDATNNIINIDGAGGVTISSVITDGVAGAKLTLNGNGGGLLLLSGVASNTYTGLTTVNVGEMDLGKTAALNAIAGNLTIGDGTGAANTAIVKLINADQIANTSDVTMNSDGVFNLNGKNETIDALNSASSTALISLGAGTLTVGANNETSFAYAGTSSGTGGLTKAGSGTLILSGANGYTGDTTIKAGELFLTASGSLASIVIRLGDTIASNPSAMFTFGSTSGGVTIANALTTQTSGGADGTRALLGLATSGNTNTWAGSISLNSNLTVQSAAVGGSVVNGPGILLFQGGTINVGTSTFVVNSNLRANNADTYSIQGNVVVNEVLGSSAATGGGVLKEGSGTLILQGTSNTYTGTDASNLNNAAGTRIGLGILAIYGDGSLGLAPTSAANNVYFVAPTTSTNVDSIAPTLRADADGITLAATRNVNIASGVTGQIDSNGNTFTVAGVVNGAGNLTKIGPGTLILSGNNTYTGTTTVNAGTLLVNGDQSAATGAVTVNNSGTTLGGNGIIGGAVTVNSGANLSPGSSPGILTTGAVTLNSGSNFVLELTNTTPGTGYDQLVVNGSVTLNLGNIVIASIGALNAGDKFFVVVNDGTDPVVGAFAQGATVTFGGNNFLINYADDFGGGLVGNDISLTLQPIPEPGTWIGAALALAAIAVTQRKRFARR
jgi:autotransporter-associated beta strand protein